MGRCYFNLHHRECFVQCLWRRAAIARGPAIGVGAKLPSSGPSGPALDAMPSIGSATRRSGVSSVFFYGGHCQTVRGSSTALSYRAGAVHPPCRRVGLYPSTQRSLRIRGAPGSAKVLNGESVPSSVRRSTPRLQDHRWTRLCRRPRRRCQTPPSVRCSGLLGTAQAQPVAMMEQARQWAPVSVTLQTARARAHTAEPLCRELARRQPSTVRENMSIRGTMEPKPTEVRTWLMPTTHRRSGPVDVKSGLS